MRFSSFVRVKIFAIAAAMLFGIVAIVSLQAQGPQPKAALNLISADRMLASIRTLSSNEFQGRGPGTAGEDLTLAYLQKQFRGMGLEPGNPNGTYLQAVPLVGIRPDPSMVLTFSGHNQTLHLVFEKDFVAQTRRMVDSVHLDADMIFVGYGVQAPEYKWDDFKGVNVKGKVIVVLINDPPVPDPRMFGGKAMTYYGRWTYKFEKAAELGAAGCLIVHETEPAGYPWEVVRDSWSGETFNLVSPDKNMHRAAVEGWITHEQAQALFQAAGLDFEALKKQAVSADFHPVDLGMRAQLDIHNTLRTIESHNVIAKRTGSDPTLKNQYVIYSAHWDHFGIGPEVNGDKIYHGALDNASGTAALLEIARAYAQVKPPPRRTILFLSVTAEEQGLLGSEYYAEHPLYPVAQTAADINMDGMNVWGKTRDITEIGEGKSTLDEVVAEAAREQGRTVRPDPEPEKGYYYRSDHFSFAKVGIPAFDPDAGIDFIGKPAGWGLTKRQEYTANNYHKPSDVIQPDWNLSGAVQDAQLFFLVGYKVANAAKMPEWKPDAEFRAIRQASLKGGR
ncbi:MAG TPA: M28 family peptidase [Candidatus Acidoferrales bacterium]|nr:M28 family peptidase [Candidatus Acidoferrales bacterium]